MAETLWEKPGERMERAGGKKIFFLLWIYFVKIVRLPATLDDTG